MRILFAITKGEVGGAQEHVRILARGMVTRGHQVGLVVQPGSHLGEVLGANGVEVLDWPSVVRNPHPVKDVAARRELSARVESFGPDILHLHSAKAGLLGRRLRTATHRTVYTSHHLPFGPGRQLSHRITARPVEQVALRHVDGIITVGARDMPTIRELAPGVPLRLVRNAVDPLGPPPSAGPRPRRAVWVARLRRPKDPLQAVAAWEHVAREVPDAELTVCGTGPLEYEVRRRAAASSAATRIAVLGHVPDLVTELHQASVYLLTTDVEGGNTMATLEAMSTGLVPVISDAGDAMMYDHARCGLVVPRRSPRTAAQCVVSLFRNPAMLEDMSRRALDFATARTTDDMVDETVAFYGEILGRG